MKIETSDQLHVVPITDADIAAMPLDARAARVVDMQRAYWEPLLRNHFPDLFSEERPDSIRLALTLTDFKLKEKRLKHKILDQKNSAIRQLMYSSKIFSSLPAELEN